MRKSPYLLLIAVLSLLPLVTIFVTPLLPHTSDGVVHAIRSAAYYKEAVAGQWPVRWTHQFHYGYGTALFNFTAPLPYIINLPLVAAGLPLTLVLKMAFALSYVLSGIFMYLFAAKLFGSKKIGLAVALMYQFAPFHLVEMNVRGNLGSLYAYTFFPLLFHAVLLMREKPGYRSFMTASAAVALLCLSHTILGYAFIGLAFLFAIFLTRDFRKLAALVLAFAAGIGLAAFFVVPALLEEKYTNGYLFSKDAFYAHFPPLYKLFLPNFFDSKPLRIAEISVQIGLFHTLSLLMLTILVVTKRIAKNHISATLFILAVSAGTILFMQPVAKPLWEHVRLIRQFQYPWRFLAFIVFTSSMSAGYVLASLKGRIVKPLTVGFLILAIVSTAFFWKPTQGFDNPDETAYWNYPLTTNYFSEVNTIWMGEEPKGYPEKRIEVIGEGAAVTSLTLEPTHHAFTVSSPVKSLAVDRTFFFPGWKARIDGKDTAIQFQDPNYRGMITFEVPPGTHQVKVQFEQSKIQKAGNLITVLTIALFMLYPLSFRIRKKG